MAYKIFDDLSADSAAQDAPLTLHIDGQQSLDLPDASFVRDADLQRDGMDLVLQGPDGTIIIENYFAAVPTPNLIAPNGETLTPDLVDSFAQSPAQYAENATANDASPVGEVQEVSGSATVVRQDGSVETIAIGTPIYQGDIVETDAEGAVNIVFIDETSFAISEDARLAIDEYVFDPETQSGSSDFSILKGVFVFTSGLIGRDDPDDVSIDTPVGSIGIRGTIIMGDVETGEITVVEGAIVLRDFQGHEVTLASQFESAKFVPGDGIESMGTLSAHEVGTKFASVSTVSGTLFSSINDVAAEPLVAIASEPAPEETIVASADTETQQPAPSAETQPQPQLAETIVQPVTQPLPPPGSSDPFTGQTASLTTTTSGTAPTAPMPAPASPTESTTTNTGPAMGSGDISGGTTGTGNTLPPPLVVNIQKFAVPENQTGSFMVARLTGDFSPVVNYSLFDPNGAYTLVPIDARTVEIWTTISTALDKEGGDYMPPLGFSATNGTGSATVTGPLNINIGNVNEAPEYDPKVPNEFFAASEGTSWVFHFNKEFFDVDMGDSLRFELDATTIAALDAYEGSYSFDPATGRLIMNVDNTLGADDTITINIRAIDQSGLASVYEDYTFSILAPTVAWNNLITSHVNQVLSTNNMVDVTVNGGNGNDIFTGNGDDIVRFVATFNNTIHSGNGHDLFMLDGSSAGNILIAGYGNDTFNMQNSNNRAYGMDGDDTFIIDEIVSDIQAGNVTGFGIDGGHSNLRFLNPGSDGRGDTLKLLNGTDVNFSLIRANGNDISYIERIDTDNGGQANDITLSYSDVLSMTDGKNTLILDLDAADRLTFGDEGNDFVKTHDNITINERKQGDSVSDFETYDVYTDGHVTLLVNSDVNPGNITGLPA